MPPYPSIRQVRLLRLVSTSVAKRCPAPASGFVTRPASAGVVHRVDVAVVTGDVTVAVGVAAVGAGDCVGCPAGDGLADVEAADAATPAGVDVVAPGVDEPLLDEHPVTAA